MGKGTKPEPSAVHDPSIDFKRLKQLKGASISLLSSDMKILWANKFLEEIHGPLPDHQGRYCHEVYHGQDHVCSDCIPIKTIKSKSIEMGIVKRKSRDGTTRYMQSVSVPFLDSKDRTQRILEILFDVTKARRLEKQLIQNEKMRTIGTLSASLAHEIKNPLNSIVINLEILRNQLEAQSKTGLIKYAEIIRGEISRLNQVMENFLNYAKPQSSKFELINLNEIVSGVLDLMRLDAEQDEISFKKKLFPDLELVFGEESQIKQILVNLILNCLQAMPDGGVVSIETKHSGDGMVELVVADTGKGIKKEDQGSVLRPFFTTRKEGSGLGLSTVVQLMKNHEGEVEFESTEGEGTTFRLRFPTS